MTNKEAIITLKANYPDACFGQLREAVDAAIEALKAQQAAGDTISRQAVIEKLKREEKILYSPAGLKYLVRAIESLPSAQPETHEERKTGHWVGAREYCNHLNDEAKREGRTEKYMPSGMVIGVYCDQCWAINTKRGNYCSNCGARMEGES